MSDFGYGQQDPSDTASAFNAHSFLVNQILGRVRTMALVKVLSCTNTGALAAFGFVSVQPLVNQTDGLGNATPHGQIFNLPYFRMQGGANAIIMDPVAGDIGLAVISDRDISSVKANQGQANPGSRRRFDLADGVYIGGILNGAPTQYIQFNSDGITIADKNSNSIVMSAAGITVTGNLIVNNNLQLAGTIESVTGSTYSGDIKTSGNVVAGQGGVDQVSLRTHKHGTGTPVAGTSMPTAGT